jgi:hypothetical protein
VVDSESFSERTKASPATMGTHRTFSTDGTFSDWACFPSRKFLYLVKGKKKKKYIYIYIP